MDATTAETPVKRDGNGRFAPGQSGNPAGKKPGTPNRVTRLREVLAEATVERAAEVLTEQVNAGNGVAARFVLDRLFPKPRDREIDLALEPKAGASMVDLFDRVLWLMAAGELSVDEASRMTRLILQRRNEFGATPSATGRPAAQTPSPAFDLQTAGDAAADRDASTAADAPPPQPLNRRERRRAAALQRGARAPTTAPLSAAA